MGLVTIISWNVNGIRAVYKKNALEELFSSQPDIVCMQETKISDDKLTPALRDRVGYQSYFDFAEKKGYSGVATFTRLKPVRVQIGMGSPDHDTEGRTLITDYGAFILMNIYFPNGGRSPERLAYKMAFYDAFLKTADSYVKAGRNIVFCGDVNTAHKEIDLARPKENEKVSGFMPEERAWIDQVLEHDYVDTFRFFNQQPDQYTWWDLKTHARERNIGWRIDYFFVNKGFQNAVVESTILPDIMGSDHCPIRLVLNLTD